jgi:predicted nuclease with TOPRIM domain
VGRQHEFFIRTRRKSRGDSWNVVAVNREYAELKEEMTKLTAEWEGLVSEAERIEADYRRRREDLA